MLCMNDLLFFIGDPGPLFIVLALTGPELGVAISQAHVSTISICIYLNDATNLHQSGYLFIIEQKRGSERKKVYFFLRVEKATQGNREVKEEKVDDSY